MVSLSVCGGVIVASFVALACGHARDGSTFFLICIALASVGYAGALFRIARPDRGSRALPSRGRLALVLLLALAMRLPALYPDTGAGSDIFRYLWDARVQRHGVNPYLAIPSDPAHAPLHTDDTRRMNNMGVPSPYPPAAQIFFRVVASVRESPRAIKAALILVDEMAVIALVALLRTTGRTEWLAITYAWHPLVVLEGARNGHLDAVGALLLVCAALALVRGRSLVAALAFAVAIAVKFLPLVLAPLFWRRVRARDAAAGAALMAALYWPYVWDGVVPIGSVANVIERFRFNGPIYDWLARMAAPWLVALVALVAGLAVAAWARRRLTADAPEAWAWPIAVTLAGAPLVYPWYLVWLVPFLTTRRTLPLLVWSLVILAVYIVWAFPPGARWAVPGWLLAVEYGAVVIATVLVWRADFFSYVGRASLGSPASRRP